MKKKFFSLVFFWILCTLPVSAKKAKSIIFSGTAQESKAGLVVKGVMITSLSAEEIQKYSGKKVKVKGVVEKRKENPDRYSQDYTMPTLVRLDWIRLSD